MQCNARQDNATHFKAMPDKAKQCNGTQGNENRRDYASLYGTFQDKNQDSVCDVLDGDAVWGFELETF